MSTFSEEQIEFIAGLLFVDSYVNKVHRKRDKTTNWAQLAKDLWEDHKNWRARGVARDRVYDSFVGQVRRVVRKIEATGCEIRIVQ